jgi:5-formyltetrahydrofolate cyclo-ligase
LNDVPSQKASLRSLLLQKREKLSPEAARRKSDLVREQLFALEEFKTAALIHFYISMGHEVATLPMIQAAIALQKRVFVPVIMPESMDLRLSEFFKDSRLMPGPRGTLQPRVDLNRRISMADMDLILVPGVAFDRNGNRLGRGFGYFDRLLGRPFNKPVPVIGLAYELQVVEHVPATDRDRPVDKIITEDRVIDCQVDRALYGNRN